MSELSESSESPRILYCHCAYAQVVPSEVKSAVLQRLAEAGIAFDAVADLCEMSARRDSTLQRLAQAPGGLKIAACYPRAVKWLFAAAGAPLAPDRTEVANMRTATADEIIRSLLEAGVRPNVPSGNISTPVPSPAPGPSDTTA